MSSRLPNYQSYYQQPPSANSSENDIFLSESGTGKKMFRRKEKVINDDTEYIQIIYSFGDLKFNPVEIDVEDIVQQELTNEQKKKLNDDKKFNTDVIIKMMAAYRRQGLNPSNTIAGPSSSASGAGSASTEAVENEDPKNPSGGRRHKSKKSRRARRTRRTHRTRRTRRAH